MTHLATVRCLQPRISDARRTSKQDYDTFLVIRMHCRQEFVSLGLPPSLERARSVACSGECIFEYVRHFDSCIAPNGGVHLEAANTLKVEPLWLKLKLAVEGAPVCRWLVLLPTYLIRGLLDEGWARRLPPRRRRFRCSS